MTKKHVLMGLAGIACFVAGCIVTKEIIYNTQDVLSKETMNKLLDNVINLDCAVTATSLKNALEKEGLYTDKIHEVFKMTPVRMPSIDYNLDTGKVMVTENMKLAFNYVTVNK
jgi:hypothetical protein